ncbi:hypothetical protein [Micromonospora mirobrigensis]|uniref:MYXO-CTERM domain-containing protein n=1 Tax=Micromonospora mirobrigensis TaxID=262898 RepID=A0A1C4XLA9_9ACTN|nr:hypothetical protein [Micromonospora mirobrigensis]SCF09224.1 hypothetical protein GA0070564_103180 [Micromonospora mirobrigensis]
MAKKMLGKVVAGAALGGASLLVFTPGIAAADGHHDSEDRDGKVYANPHVVRAGDEVKLFEVCSEPQEHAFVWSKVTGKVKLHEVREDADHRDWRDEEGRGDEGREEQGKDEHGKQDEHGKDEQGKGEQGKKDEHGKDEQGKGEQGKKDEQGKDEKGKGEEGREQPSEGDQGPWNGAGKPEALGGQGAGAAADGSAEDEGHKPEWKGNESYGEDKGREDMKGHESYGQDEKSYGDEWNKGHESYGQDEKSYGDEWNKGHESYGQDEKSYGDEWNKGHESYGQDEKSYGDEWNKGHESYGEDEKSYGEDKGHESMKGHESYGQDEDSYGEDGWEHGREFVYYGEARVDEHAKPGRYDLEGSCGEGELVVLPRGPVDGGDGGMTTTGVDKGLATGGAGMLGAAALGGIVLMRRRRTDGSLV